MEFLQSGNRNPALTWYGATPGERVELSFAVLANWVAKAANALVEEFDAGPGTIVEVDLPGGHWREAYWRLAVTWIGATEGTPADVVVAEDRPGCDVAVTLAPLARRHPDLPDGAWDEAAELATYADAPPPRGPAAPPPAGGSSGRIVLRAGAGAYAAALATWHAGGSVVIVPAGTPDEEIERIGRMEGASL